MAEAFAAEVLLEQMRAESADYILEHYTTADIATAGIYLSKYLERKAMTHTGVMGQAEENYYYIRIYDMVKNKILPKVWTVTQLMFHSPQTAFYWASYIWKVCSDVKTLCLEFETVVANSTLSFSDITFLDLAPDVKEYVDFFSGDGFADLTKLFVTFTELDVSDLSLDDLIAGLVASITGAAPSIDDVVITLISGQQANLLSYMSQAVISSGVAQISIKKLLSDPTTFFTTASYNRGDFISGYSDLDKENEFFTRRYYIYYEDSGKEEVCSFTSSTSNTDEWVEYDSDGVEPSTSDVLSLIEQFACMTRDDVSSLNKEDDVYTYSYTYSTNKMLKKSSDGTWGYYKGGTITFYRSWDIREEVYEEVYDSYSMSFEGFYNKLQTRLIAYNNNEDYLLDGETQKVYQIGCDDKVYYTATNEAKIAGVNAVTLSTTCTDTIAVADGSTQYKCKTCGSTVNAHTHECAMLTSVDDNTFDGLDELQSTLAAQQASLDNIIAQMDALQEQMDELLILIANAPTLEEAYDYREQYNTLSQQYQSLKDEKTALQEEIAETEAAIDEAIAGEETDTDDYKRIPAIMSELQTTFNLVWQGDGYWSGDSYQRHCTATAFGTEDILFNVDVSIARAPKYFLGIKIHRAIVQLDWSLNAYVTNTAIADVLTFDNETSDADKAQQVNDRLSAIAIDHPNCSVDAEYNQCDTIGSDVDESNRIHLLWASDRLEVARTINARLTKIYTDLITIEKFMHYKHNVLDVFKDLAYGIDWDKGRSYTLADSARVRWLENARTINVTETWGGVGSVYGDDAGAGSATSDP